MRETKRSLICSYGHLPDILVLQVIVVFCFFFDLDVAVREVLERGGDARLIDLRFTFLIIRIRSHAGTARHILIELRFVSWLSGVLLVSLLLVVVVVGRPIIIILKTSIIVQLRQHDIVGAVAKYFTHELVLLVLVVVLVFVNVIILRIILK